jgi:hypothetical protein
MSLLSVRQMFIEATGREDLLDPGMRLGANFLINEGQRMLQRQLDQGKSGARYHVDLDIGQVLVPLIGCRAVKKVFIGDSTERIELEKVDIHILRSNYNEPIANIYADTPTYYAPIWARPFPDEVRATSFNQSWMLEDLMKVGHEGFNALLIMPPPDVATYTLEVWGLFYSEELSRDEDVSYWTEEHPLLLVQAAIQKLEGLYRNSEGWKDMKLIIGEDMMELNKDLIEEEIEGVDHMEG